MDYYILFIIIMILLILFIIFPQNNKCDCDNTIDNKSKDFFDNSTINSNVSTTNLIVPPKYKKCILTDTTGITYELVLLSYLNSEIQRSILYLIQNNIIINNQINYNDNIFTRNSSLTNNTLTNNALINNASTEDNYYNDLLNYEYIYSNLSTDYTVSNNIIFAVKSDKITDASIIKQNKPLLFNDNQELYKVQNSSIFPMRNHELSSYYDIMITGNQNSVKNNDKYLYKLSIEPKKIKYYTGSEFVYKYINLIQIGDSPIYLINLVDNQSNSNITDNTFIDY